jgi:hypothetical protein
MIWPNDLAEVRRARIDAASGWSNGGGVTHSSRLLRAFAKSTIRQISGFDLTGHPGDAKGGTFVPSPGTRACETIQMPPSRRDEMGG